MAAREDEQILPWRLLGCAQSRSSNTSDTQIENFNGQEALPVYDCGGQLRKSQTGKQGENTIPTMLCQAISDDGNWLSWISETRFRRKSILS